MEITISPLSEVLQEAEITVSGDEIQPHLDEAYGKERKRLEVKGFRKGKAPIEIIRKLYGDAIEHQALDSIANDFYRKAMDEREIRPLGEPSMVDMDYKKGEHFRFRIQYEIRPTIRMQGYTGLTVEKPIHSVHDAEVDGEITRILKSNSTTEDATSVTDKEYIVTADVQELDPAGTPIIGRKAKDVQFYLSDETVSPALTRALSQAEVGGTYRSRIEPQEDEEKQAMDVSLSVTQIRKVILPEFNDEFAKTITGGKVASAAEFRGNLTKDLERYWADWSEKKVADAISMEVVKRHDFPVPESLVNTVMDSYLADIRNRSRDRKLPPDFNEEKFRHDSRELAVWQARWILLKEVIAEAEGIKVTDEDLSATAEAEASRIGLPAEQVLSYYRNSSTAHNQILSKKIMEYLVSNTSITEKEVAS